MAKFYRPRPNAFLMLSGLIFAVICVSEAIAYAQGTVPSPQPLDQVTGLTLVTTILSVLVGFATSAVQSGSLFGIRTTPKAWLPWLALLAAAGGAAVVSFAKSNVLSPAADLNAVVAALFALFAKGAGASLHRTSNPETFVNSMGPGGGGVTTTVSTSPTVVAAAQAATALALVTLAFLAWAGCTAQQGQRAANSVPADAAFLACVWTTYQGEPAGTPALQVVDDAIKACGGDAGAVVNALDQQEPRAAHASVAHGVVGK